jgi:hypothetical protein
MGRSPSEINWISISVFEGSPINNRCWYHHRHTPDSSGKPAGCAAPEDLERIAGLGPKKDHPVCCAVPLFFLDGMLWANGNSPLQNESLRFRYFITSFLLICRPYGAQMPFSLSFSLFPFPSFRCADITASDPHAICGKTCGLR